MPEQRPTKKQHYVPVVYLDGFSPDGKHIYEYSLTDGAIRVPVKIEDVCRENFLYEVRNDDGELFNINFLEKNCATLKVCFRHIEKDC